MWSQTTTTTHTHTHSITWLWHTDFHFQSTCSGTCYLSVPKCAEGSRRRPAQVHSHECIHVETVITDNSTICKHTHTYTETVDMICINTHTHVITGNLISPNIQWGVMLSRRFTITAPTKTYKFCPISKNWGHSILSYAGMSINCFRAYITYVQ